VRKDNWSLELSCIGLTSISKMSDNSHAYGLIDTANYTLDDDSAALQNFLNSLFLSSFIVVGYKSLLIRRHNQKVHSSYSNPNKTLIIYSEWQYPNLQVEPIILSTYFYHSI